MKQEDILQTVQEVVKEFGTPVYLERGQVGENSESYSTVETLLSVTSDTEASTLASDLRAKIAAHLDTLNTEGLKRTYNGNIQNLQVVDQAPKFTYRDPMANEIPNGVLYSVSIGFPMFVAN